MKKLIVIIICVLTLNSCSIELVNDNYFDGLSVEDKARIKKLVDFESVDKKYIYEIYGQQLKEELKHHEKSLVYIFANGCKNESCLPLARIVAFSKENKFDLYLVMSGYYSLNKTLSQKVDYQLFSINSGYYEQKKTRKYVQLFEKDLGYGISSDGATFFGNYLFFEKDSLVNVTNGLP